MRALGIQPLSDSILFGDYSDSLIFLKTPTIAKAETNILVKIMSHRILVKIQTSWSHIPKVMIKIRHCFCISIHSQCPNQAHTAQVNGEVSI